MWQVVQNKIAQCNFCCVYDKSFLSILNLQIQIILANLGVETHRHNTGISTHFMANIIHLDNVQMTFPPMNDKSNILSFISVISLIHFLRDTWFCHCLSRLLFTVLDRLWAVGVLMKIAACCCCYYYYYIIIIVYR